MGETDACARRDFLDVDPALGSAEQAASATSAAGAPGADLAEVAGRGGVPPDNRCADRGQMSAMVEPGFPFSTCVS